MSSSTSVSRAYVLVFLLTTAAGLLASVALTELELRRRVMPTDSFVAYKQLFRHGTAPAAAFGDSHVANGLVSVPELDNLGQAGDTLDTSMQKAMHRVARGGVRHVVLQADPQMFSAYRLRADQHDRMSNLTREDDPPLALLRPEYRQYLMQFWWQAVANLLVLRHPPQVGAETPDEGIEGRPLQERRQEALLRVQLHTPVPRLVASSAARTYREAAEAMLGKGLRVCLVGFPVTSYYREAIMDTGSFGAARAFFVDLARELRVPYLDYAAALPDSDFGDPDHLRRKSAEQFTRMVLRDCFAESQGAL